MEAQTDADRTEQIYRKMANLEEVEEMLLGLMDTLGDCLWKEGGPVLPPSVWKELVVARRRIGETLYEVREVWR
jgi:hypothetical protein